jgi:protein DJ-1
MADEAAKRALVILATGAEEMEVTITVDVLRRGGIEVVLAGLDGDEPVTCSRRVRLVPDIALAQAQGPFDVVVLPGGLEGTERLAASTQVGELLRSREASGELVAAICAAPLALQKHGVFGGRAMTCHPGVEAIVKLHGVASPGTVVDDGNLVTSRGPGTAFEFALALVARLVGPERAAAVRAPMMLAGG